MAPPWPWGFFKALHGNNGWRFAPNPFALRARAAPRLQRPPWVFCGLTIRWDNGPPIVVTGLPGIDPLGEDVSDCGHVPDRVLARWRGRVGGVQALGALSTTQLLFHQGTIKAP